MAEKNSRAKSAMGGKKSKSKSGKRPHEIHIKHGKSGGFIVHHIHKADPDTGEIPEMEEHVVPDQPSLLDHVAQNTEDQAAPQSAAPDPQAQQQAAPAGM